MSLGYDTQRYLICDLSSVPVTPFNKILTLLQSICIGNSLENTVLGMSIANSLALEDTRFPWLEDINIESFS